MKRSLYYKISVFTAIIISLTVAACYSQEFAPSSVVKREAELVSLIDSLKKYRAIMQDYSDKRMKYFQQGLGWQNGDQYGFSTAKRMVYFTETSVGVTMLTDSGESDRIFTARYSDKIHWVTYSKYKNNKPEKPQLSVGFNGNRVIQLFAILHDSTIFQYWEKGYKVIYPSKNEELNYMLHYWRSEPTLTVSPALIRLIFSKNTDELRRKLYCDDIISDFPYPFFSQILSDAIQQNIDITNGNELSDFTINRFRQQVGLHKVDFNELLFTSAKNHAEYLIQNQVVKKMLKWNVETINLDDYLDIHNEKSSRKGFTGEKPVDRTAFSGYGSNSGECATLGRFEEMSELFGFFHSIFHRRPFMDFRTIHFGHFHLQDAADASVTTGVTNWGYDFDRKTDGYIIYPHNGSKLIPWAWCEVESPDPFPELASGTGVPITISFTNEKYMDGNVALFDKENNRIKLITSTVEPSKRNFIEIVPSSPLKPNAEYTIRFTYQNQTDIHTFTTAPINPAEDVVNQNLQALSGTVDFRNQGFDVKKAMALNNAKGELISVKREGAEWLTDKKYGFRFQLPNGWSIEKPEWQEILLKNSYNSIHFLVQPLGNSLTAESIFNFYSKNISYKAERKDFFSTKIMSGYKVRYKWEYENFPIIYYMIYNDYAFIVYGYGVTDELMDGLMNSVEWL